VGGLLIDAAGAAWLAIGGLLSDDPLGRNIALGVATIFAVSLAVLFVVLALCPWWRSVIGMWICLALGSVPIILVPINIALHSA
jgi:predicted RND superfamily exporter protein